MYVPSWLDEGCKGLRSRLPRRDAAGSRSRVPVSARRVIRPILIPTLGRQPGRHTDRRSGRSITPVLTVGDENADASVHHRDRCWTLTGMRNTHSCPKCRSTVILQIPGKLGAYGVGNNIPVGWSNFSAVLVTRSSTCTAGRSKDGGPRTQRGGQRGDDGTVASRQRQTVRRQTC